MLRHIFLAAATSALLAAPILAQDGEFEMPQASGMAVSQAAEAGLGVCFGSEAAETMQCAQAECMEQSGLGELDCAVNLWCYPHAWAAQIAVLHTEGIHWSKFICDENSRDKLDAAVALYCDEEFFAECLAMRIWDPDGTAVLDSSSRYPPTISPPFGCSTWPDMYELSSHARNRWQVATS